MSYLVIARKYRPGTFDEVVGQPATARTLKNAIQLDRIAHAYLFAGPRGVGKTSMARILARAMRCAEGPTPTPCGECDACVAIQKGNDLDVVEIDAASNRGIDDIRALREKARVGPMRGQSKLYIIDEVHQLTSEAFNALLKILEEPPAHVLFVLATTEPERVPDTIRSRCQFFEFRKVPESEIRKRLITVCEAEGIEFEEQALALIARAARGGVRDSQSLLDQSITHGNGKVTAAGVMEVTGSLSPDVVRGLLRMAVDGQTGELLAEVERLDRHGITAEGIVEALLDEVRDLLAVAAAGKDAPLLDESSDREEWTRLAGSVGVDGALAISGLLLEARRRVRELDEPRLPLEAALIRMSRLGENLPIEQAIELVRKGGGAGAPRSGPADPPARGPGAPTRPAAPGKTDGPRREETAGTGAASSARLPEGSRQALEQLTVAIGQRSAAIRSFLAGLTACSFDGSILEVTPKKTGPSVYDLGDEKVIRLVRETSEELFGTPVRLVMSAAAKQVPETTAAGESPQGSADSQEQAGSDGPGGSAESMVDQARRLFDGKLIE